MDASCQRSTRRFYSLEIRSWSLRSCGFPYVIAKTAQNHIGHTTAYQFDELKTKRTKDPSKFMNKILGIILIVIGIAGLAWGGFSYTTRETVADIGPIHATRDKSHSVPLPPIAGAVALIGGVALLVVGKNS